MEKTSVQMEQDMLDDLEEIGKLEEQNRSQIIRKAVKNHIQGYKDRGEIK